MKTKKEEQPKEQEKKDKKVMVGITPIRVASVEIKVIGKTPLLMDKFSDEVKKDILAKQTGIAKSIKKSRDIDQEIKRAVHFLSNGKVGFPTEGFKKGMIEATSFVGDKFFSKKLVRGIQFVNGSMVEIKYKKQDVLEHTIKGITKFSPQFHEWSCELEILYDKNNISTQDIVTLLNYAGFYYGIGCWRPSCQSGGNFGMYEVEFKGGYKDEEE